MYQIERRPFGFLLTFSGFIPVEEMTAWVAKSRTELAHASKGFGILVDMRSLKPLSPEAKTAMEEGQKLYKAAGMGRSAVILDSSLLTMQFKNIAKDSGIYQWERYLNASAHPDWEQLAIDWIKDGKDPDATVPKTA